MGGRLALHPEHLGQGGPELGGHEAVEGEVGGAVPQGQQVHHLPQGGVALGVELLAMVGRQHAQDALGHSSQGGPIAALAYNVCQPIVEQETIYKFLYKSN